ncbi:hypothetical protein AWB75_00951 [Caballeronia catudaia]|uniref:Uncharacterized protein n=1 Tax=Caballeronia catudaia TaxID=1777136 RepID=A0A157ZM65_9BURK|nr:hypothetical protein [Caballeronia catudaia]SAK46605.1 hypothetical protein AWB75_00951 [Caballeronia catudaia]
MTNRLVITMRMSGEQDDARCVAAWTIARASSALLGLAGVFG